VAGQARDQHRRYVDRADVWRADGDGSEPTCDEQRHPSDRPDDQRLQQTALGIAADDAEREEDREHDAEEERSEHREPKDRRAREGPRVDARRRSDVVDVLEQEVVREPEEREKGSGQEKHDREDLPT
jgi:hypothetical protein